MDQTELAGFLRTRRTALQPEDVGLARGPRRRTSGLRREEVAALVGMSPDYYARLERAAGPQPSEQMVAAVARGLRLSMTERDHLFLLAGHRSPRKISRSDHVSPGLMRILDRLQDTPAQVMGGIGETLAQTVPATALFGDQTQYAGADRSVVYRWFTDPSSRHIYVADDHPRHGMSFTALLRRSAAQQGTASPAARLAATLVMESGEFAHLWAEHDIDVVFSEQKRLQHPQVGRLDLFCQTLLDPDQLQSLLVFTATPGSESHDKLDLLAVLAGQSVASTFSCAQPGA